MVHSIYSYRDLFVWQRAIELTIKIYRLTDQFPWSEQRGLSSQMQRAAVSIASNIAEGRCRGTRREFIHFLYISFASGAELETQLCIAKQLYKAQNLSYEDIEHLLEEIMKMLNALIHSLKPKT